MKQLTEILFDYFKTKIGNFENINRKGQILFSCPNIKKHRYVSKLPTAMFINNTGKITCLQCGWKGTWQDAIRLIEPDKKEASDQELLEYMYTQSSSEKKYPELEEYEKYGWVLFPIAKNGKVPLKGERWRELDYRKKTDWFHWLENGLNLAVNCEKSNIMIIDVDNKESLNSLSDEQKKVRENLIAICEESETLVQNTAHGGKHYVYVLDKEIPQQVNIGELKIDTRTEKGYFLVSPSKLDNSLYTWVNIGHEIKKIPDSLKSNLLKLIEVDKGRNKIKSEETGQKIIEKTEQKVTEVLKLKNNNLEGCCNNTFVQLGGMLIKKLKIDDVRFVLHLLNRYLLERPMPSSSVEAMIGSLEGYQQSEEQTQQETIYNYLKLIKSEVSAKDIMEHTGLKRAIIDKYLSQFVREGKAIRLSRGWYKFKEKVEWTDQMKETIDLIEYDVPFFNDVAYFQQGDIVVLGGKTGHGKTHIAMNIIRILKNQNIKPYYISLESGSRHQKIAERLGIKNSDYYMPKEPIDNPLHIEIEPNAFTLIDWLYTGDDFAATMSIFKHLNDEMRRKGGILFVFTQLKENYDWFAVNLLKSFPSLTARYIWDDENGKYGHWEIDKIRDAKGNYTIYTIPCEYDWETKIFKIRHNI